MTIQKVKRDDSESEASTSFDDSETESVGRSTIQKLKQTDEAPKRRKSASREAFHAIDGRAPAATLLLQKMNTITNYHPDAGSTARKKQAKRGAIDDAILAFVEQHGKVARADVAKHAMQIGSRTGVYRVIDRLIERRQLVKTRTGALALGKVTR